MNTLAEALPHQMARVRDHILPAYVALGQEGEPYAGLMSMDLEAASQALASGDLIGMARVFDSLRDWQLPEP